MEKKFTLSIKVLVREKFLLFTNIYRTMFFFCGNGKYTRPTNLNHKLHLPRPQQLNLYVFSQQRILENYANYGHF